MRTRSLLVAALLGFVCTTGVTDAAVLQYEAVLSGAAEAPANASPGTGSAAVTVDTVARTFLLDFAFSDLLGTTTAAHIHGATALPGTGTAGVMTQTPFFAGFPTGVTSGTFSALYDMTSATTWSASFVGAQGSIANAETAFLASLASGTAYLNIHSVVFGGGEIRGFFAPVNAVPLPAGLLLMLSALAILGLSGGRGRVSV